MDNEDQLAMVIGHEMAHAIMLHAVSMVCLTNQTFLTLLHSKQPKFHRVLAVLSAVG